jgi:hypothetical protein
MEKTKCEQKNKKPMEFNNLSFAKCIFFTNEQYNKTKIHIPSQSLYVEKTAFITNIETTIDNTINEIYIRLNRYNSNPQSPILIPAPIFVLMGRDLEYDKNILDGEYFEHVPWRNTKIGNSMVQPIPYDDLSKEMKKKRHNLAIVDYMNAYLNSGLETKKDVVNYDMSLIKSYAFKGNFKIGIYVPYLTNKYKYVSNFRDILNSGAFFYTLIKSANFLNVKKMSNLNINELRTRLKKGGLTDTNIEIIVELVLRSESNKYPLFDDLMNMCYDGGCVSNTGEDIEKLVPQYTEDENKNEQLTNNFSPFIPNKCLSKTNGYICNVRFSKDENKDTNNFLKTFAMDDIRTNLTKYTELYDKIRRNEDVNNNYKEIDKYKSPIDLIISIVNRFIKDGYSNNLNDRDRNGIRLNHYSKEYTENILKELAILQKLYPGIPEMVMSLYRYKSEKNANKIILMPWGERLLSFSNVLNMSETLKINKSIYSFNGKYGLTINQNGLIYVYELPSKQIRYYLNEKPYKEKILGLMVDILGIKIELIDKNKNKNFRDVEGLPSLADMSCKECKSPYSLILEDDGSINIYGNSFYRATNKSLTEFISNKTIEQETRRNRNRRRQLMEAGMTSEIEDEIEAGVGTGMGAGMGSTGDRYLYCSPNSSYLGCFDINKSI